MAINKLFALGAPLIIIFNWHAPVVQNDNVDNIIEVAIRDFVKSSPLSKRDSVFSVGVKEFDDEIVGVSIYGSTIKPNIMRNGNEIDVSRLPTKYVEMNGKLFYWDDKETHVTPEMISVLKKYNFIDTSILNVYIPPYHIDDAKKAEDYYFCKRNIKKFKKVRTNMAMGHYPIPRLNCR